MIMKWGDVVNNRIKTFREMKELSQAGLAEKMGITQKKMSQIENSVIDPSLAEINKLTTIFDRSFEDLFVNEEGNSEMNKHILIKYVQMDKHVDPNFTYLAYGDSNKRGTRLDNIVSIGSYAFFHTSIGSSEYLTGYFKIEKILHKGKDDIEIETLPFDAKVDDIIIIGSRADSKILTLPLLFDKKLAVEVTSLGVTSQRFTETDASELSVISNATREHRELSQFDTEFLIRKCEGRG